MPWLAHLSSLTRNLLRKPRAEQELDDELRAYLDLLTGEKTTAGMSPDEARRQAMIELGGLEQIKEQVREVRIGSLLETLLQDLRYGVRVLVKAPGFTLAAMLSLAVGIGGNAAMFTLVNGILIQPLPYPRPGELLRVAGFYPKGAVVALQQLSRTMDVAGFTTDSEFNLAGQGEAVHLAGSSVSANLFTLLGARAEIGRTFQPGEDRFGQDRLVILSHALWRNQFGGNPGIIGRWIAVDGLSRQVVAVMPPAFSFPAPGVQLWIPLSLDPAQWADFWGAGFMPVIARLRPGANLEQAQDEIRPLISRIITMFPYTMARNWNADAVAVPLQHDMVGAIGGKLLLLSCAIGIVLLIACANVSSILLSRSAARRKEMALRAALGAARGRIVRQLLTESVLLALAGGGLGLTLAFAAVSMLKSALPADTPRLVEVGIGGWVVLFVTVLAILTGFAFGLAPALSASRSDIAELIKGGGQRSAAGAGIRLRNSLIAAEVALAFTLVLSAGLLIQSLWRLMQVNPGFRPEQILTVRVFPNQSSCVERTECITFYDKLLRQVRGITGVSDIAAGNAVPLSGEISTVPVEVEDRPLKPAEHVAPVLWAAAITPEYFRIMRIPIVEGRSFTDSDTVGSAGVVLVSAATARHFWPGQDPCGKLIRPVWDRHWRTVVGVVGDVRQYKLTRGSPDGISGVVYMPYPQAVGLNRQLPAAMTLLVRTAADSARVADEIRGIVSALSANVPVGEVRTMDSVVSASTSQSRSLAWLFAGFAGSALILAAIGVYGVVAFSTAQRTYEMGVRVALGATRRSILDLVLRQTLQLVLIGLAVGVIASLAVARMLAGLLYGVAATDPATFLAVAALVLLVALLAGYVPARRAAAVDPVTALRVD